MSVLLITVGTSAVENRGVGRSGKRTDNTVLQKQMALFRDASDKGSSRWNVLLEQLVAAHIEYWTGNEEYTGNPKNFDRSSAELTSTRPLLKVKACERIVLLSSDTDTCWLCTQVVERVMKESWGITGVSACRVAGLKEPSEHSRRQLETAICDGGVRPPIIANLTGGFKGEVIAMTLLAVKYEWDIYYQHESMKEAVPVLLPYEGGRWTPTRLST